MLCRNRSNRACIICDLLTEHLAMGMIGCSTVVSSDVYIHLFFFSTMTTIFLHASRHRWSSPKRAVCLLWLLEARRCRAYHARRSTCRCIDFDGGKPAATGDSIYCLRVTARPGRPLCVRAAVMAVSSFMLCSLIHCILFNSATAALPMCSHSLCPAEPL